MTVSRIRVLVIEDDKSWHNIIHHALSSTPIEFDFSFAPNFDKACLLLERQSFDLVTVDMALSEMEEKSNVNMGQLLIHRLSKDFPGTYIIVISGSKGFQERPDQVAELFTEYNVTKFIWKGDPDIFAKLHKTVKTIFQPTREVNMTSQVQKLKNIQSEIKAIEQAICELKSEYKKGSLPDAQYFKLYRVYESDRNNLIDQIDALLSGPDGEVLRAVLKNKKEDDLAETEAVKEELKAAAEKRGWGQKVLMQINEHKGETVSLVVAIALELGKRVIAGI